MYEKYYGLREAAFNLTPDPSFLYLNQRSKDALDQIMYSIERREGFSVIVGDIGTGKTTLCWALLDRLAPKNVSTAFIQNPMLSEIEILKSILQDLGVRPERPYDGLDPDEIFSTDWMDGMTKKQLLDRLNHFLVARAQEGAFTVLIVDEAQNLSLAILEQLRLLSNLETAKMKLLQIIFVGQLELNAKLNSPVLRQLNQRISVRFQTQTLSPKDTDRYIRHRVAAAGGGPRLNFTGSAIRAIWRYSKGYPRKINLVCDRALMEGYQNRATTITPSLVRNAARVLEGRSDKRWPILPWEGLRRFFPAFAIVVVLITILCYFLSSKGSNLLRALNFF
ncbi:MAG: AAA family ATPase [Acidobacteriota bacterium]|jgi:general secretion pathway protein A|nr:AAA family ATPase [Acidobacteriota bacterium]